MVTTKSQYVHSHLRILLPPLNAFHISQHHICAPTNLNTTQPPPRETLLIVQPHTPPPHRKGHMHPWGEGVVVAWNKRQVYSPREEGFEGLLYGDMSLVTQHLQRGRGGGGHEVAERHMHKAQTNIQYKCTYIHTHITHSQTHCVHTHTCTCTIHIHTHTHSAH